MNIPEAGDERKMISLKDRIVKRLDQLPESNLREVLNFVEFMTRRSVEQNDPLF